MCYQLNFTRHRLVGLWIRKWSLDKTLNRGREYERLIVYTSTGMSASQLMVSKEFMCGAGFGARNLEGEVLLEFADSHSLVITNTCFTKVDLKKNYT